MDKHQLRSGTKQFALRIMRLVDTLPRTTKGHWIGDQLPGAGTSVAANYRAACRARSRAEFIAKLGNSEEEADESGCFLELISEDRMLKAAPVAPLLTEVDELLAILAASRITPKARSLRQIGNRKSEIGNR